MISNVERVIKKSLEDAKTEGMEKGMEEGIKKGIKEGLEKGLEKGMEIVARQMLSEGEEIAKIMRYTGLSRENVEKLK